MIRIIVICLCSAFIMINSALPSVVPVLRMVSEAVEVAAKKSGRVLAPAAREAAESALSKLVTKYGDDILQSVKMGGLEAIEQGAKYGDDFWALCAKTPAATRALALHADDLIPLTRRIGSEVLEFEVRNPGLTMRVVSEFGDDAVKALANTPPDDVSRLLGYAAKADSPATKVVYQIFCKIII